MYDAVADPYCYDGTTVLKNIPGIRDQDTLDAFEAVSTAQRADEPLPPGRLSLTHYGAIHRHLFQDVYVWAGKFRTVRMNKAGSAFCYPENIAREMRGIFADLKRDGYYRRLAKTAFAGRAAHFLTNLNAIHPFREGNGRTQMSFMVLLAEKAGYPFNLERIDPGRFMNAMIASFQTDEELLLRELTRLID